MRAKRRKGVSGGEEPQLVYLMLDQAWWRFLSNLCFHHSLKHTGFNFYVTKTKAASSRFLLLPQGDYTRSGSFPDVNVGWSRKRLAIWRWLRNAVTPSLPKPVTKSGWLEDVFVFPHSPRDQGLAVARRQAG